VHRHDLLGKTWDRRSEGMICPYCKEHGDKNVSFVDGLIIHLALTRIPANPQTFIVEAEAKMAQKSQAQVMDATSIVGEELAQAMAEAEMSKMAVGEEVIITKAEDPDEEKPDPEEDEDEKPQEEKACREDEKMGDKPDEDEDEEEEDEDMDKIFAELKVLATQKSDSRESHIQAINAAYEMLAAKMSEKVNTLYVPEQKSAESAPAIDMQTLKSDIVKEVTDALMPLIQNMSVQIQTLGDVNAAKSMALPEREVQAPPAPINKQQVRPHLQQPEVKTSVIRRIAMKSVGLPDSY
jgi:copper chaperone CopZ